MKKITLSLIVLLLVGGMLSAQDRTLVGKVTSADDGSDLPGVSVLLKGTTSGVVTDARGNYLIHVPVKGGTLVFSFIGLKTQEIAIGISNRVDITMVSDVSQLSEVVVTGYGLAGLVPGIRIRGANSSKRESNPASTLYDSRSFQDTNQPRHNTEEYDGITENIFHEALKNPLSTFSIDVDAASYSNVRRFITSGQQVPKDAVRVEEMINYFKYDYDQPKGDDPFSINTEISIAPWNKKHKVAVEEFFP